MARKILGQAFPGAGQLIDLYTVPEEKDATISTVVVCNLGDRPADFRISVAVAGAADEYKQYLWYDVVIPVHDTFAATIGITLAETDVMRCLSSGLVSFNVFGDES